MGANLSVEKIDKENLYLDRLPPQTRKAFLYCAENFNFLEKSKWYLAGGTALALQVGHRQSIDLDFFLPEAKFEEMALERFLTATGEWTTSLRQEGTIYGVLLGAKMSFISYPLFKPVLKKKRIGYVQMLLPRDIAAMKMLAVSQRGRKRDFVDIYWYCKNKESLFDILLRATNQYPGQEDNLNHILRSLVYFKDAERDPMPKIFFKATWSEIKKYFQREVPAATKQFLRFS